MRLLFLTRPLRMVRLAPAPALALALALVAACPPLPAQPAPSPAAMASTGPNVYTAGGQVRPAGPVQGDYSAAGGHIVLDQPVGGDAALLAGSVEARAPVTQDLRIAAGHVVVGSSVGGELLASGGDITLTREASVAQGARLYAGSVRVEGRIDSELIVRAQTIVINGDVRGDAQLAGQHIKLGPMARIDGTLSYVSPSELKQERGASVLGAVRREASPGAGSPARPQTAWSGGVLAYLGLLACAALLLAAAPRFTEASAARIRTLPWQALGMGLVLTLAVPMLAMLLFVTLLGIPLGVLVLSLYPLLLLVGLLVGVAFVAQRGPALLRRAPATRWPGRLGWFALALLVVVLLASVPVLGGLLVTALCLCGLGACVLEVQDRRKGPGATSATTQIEPVPFPPTAQQHA